MDHLAAYVVLREIVYGRTVLVVRPTDAQGPRILQEAGARVVTLGGHANKGDFDRLPEGTEESLSDGSVHVVACIEAFSSMPVEQRRILLMQARRVLDPEGLCAVWTGDKQLGAPELDFFALEREVSEVFASVQMIAQIPWSGFSCAPVVDANAASPTLELGESLLTDVPRVEHYLALGAARRTSSLEKLAGRCVLVPVSADVATDVAAMPFAVAEIDAGVAEAPAEAQRRCDEQDELIARLRAGKEASDQQLEQQAQALSAAQERALELEGRLTATDERLKHAVANGHQQREHIDQLERRLHDSAEQLAVAARKAEVCEDAAVQLRVAVDAWSMQEHAMSDELSDLRIRVEDSDLQRRAAVQTLAAREIDVTLLTGTVNELEAAVQAAAERAEVTEARLAETLRVHDQLLEQHHSLRSECESLARALEVMVAERAVLQARPRDASAAAGRPGIATTGTDDRAAEPAQPASVVADPPGQPQACETGSGSDHVPVPAAEANDGAG